MRIHNYSCYGIARAEETQLKPWAGAVSLGDAVGV
jgi:hypothetical protein